MRPFTQAVRLNMWWRVPLFRNAWITSPSFPAEADTVLYFTKEINVNPIYSKRLLGFDLYFSKEILVKKSMYSKRNVGVDLYFTNP